MKKLSPLEKANKRIKELEEALEEARRPNPVWEKLDAVAKDVLDLHQKVADAPKHEPDVLIKKLGKARGMLYEIHSGIKHNDLDVTLEEIDRILQETKF